MVSISLPKFYPNQSSKLIFNDRSVFDPNRHASICDPKDILIGDTFFTGTNAFRYAVTGASLTTMNASHDFNVQDQAGWSYSGNSLVENCLVHSQGPRVNVIANLEQQSVIGTVGGW